MKLLRVLGRPHLRPSLMPVRHQEYSDAAIGRLIDHQPIRPRGSANVRRSYCRFGRSSPDSRSVGLVSTISTPSRQKPPRTHQHGQATRERREIKFRCLEYRRRHRRHRRGEGVRYRGKHQNSRQKAKS